ncbi:YidC/Oxa1 family membrane protein insertase, partial [Candidatus Peregrinibacteria bacterium]|nr:YidC/Oxa1 family membrane protein insertase [Candidatus Peregrinibacteria bacterium]
MNKLNQILKNVLLFLAVFLVINYIMQLFLGEDKKEAINTGNLIFETTETEYSPYQTVTVEISNYTDKPVLIPNNCPSEPLTVERYENNEWVSRTVNPKLDCTDNKEITIKPGETTNVAYDNWNFALFSDLGRFRISLSTELNGEQKTLNTNEFSVVEEGIFRKLWVGLFYKPIYNGLIFLVSVMPGHYLGLAIILLTIIIRTILLLPSHKAMKAQKRMQEIQPRLEKIKE